MPRSISPTDSALDFAPIDEELLGNLLDDDVADEEETEATATVHNAINIQPRALAHDALIKLVVPLEVINMPVDIASRDKGLCSRLEDTIIQWNKQIKEVLHGQSRDIADMSGPLDEIQFWENKYLDLSELTRQIRSRPIRLVRDIMSIIKSPYIASFIKVSQDILQGSIEAISNHHYLGALRECSVKLEESTINELPDQLKQILWIVRVIWRHSPYYNTREKLNGLLRKFSNAFILKCTSVINVRQVFRRQASEESETEETLRKCLSFLLLWRTKYFEAQKMHSINSYDAWLLEYDKIFAHVDAFVQRVRDLLEVCNCRRLFAHGGLPVYPGTNASELTKVMTEVGKMFEVQLKTLSGHSGIALSVRHAEWHHPMSIFKMGIKDMELMIQSVLTASFDTVTNIEQGLLLLESFYPFYQRESIVRAYDRLTVRLFKLFEQEVNHVKRLHGQNILPLPLTYPEIGGRGAWAVFMKQRLDANYQIIKDAWWLPDCGYGADVVFQYKEMAATLHDTSLGFYADWLKQVGTKDLTARLDVPLMIRSLDREGMVEMNFDKFLYRHIAEAEVWAGLGKEIPEVLRNVFKQRERLHRLRETVMLVVKDYNRIVTSLSPAERSLFKERTKLLDRKLYPGLTRLTWASDVSDSYIKDCRQAASKVQDYTNDYKQGNVKIGQLVRKMTRIRMIKVEPTRTFKGDEFNEFQRKHREKAILKIATKYKEVTLILRSVFEMFRGDGPEVKMQWLKYLNTIDSVIEEGLCVNLRSSLQVLTRAIRGDVRRPPIFRLNLIRRRDDDKLDFHPTLKQVTEMVLGIFGKICHSIRYFPRVIQFLNDPGAIISSFSEVMGNDGESVRIQGELRDGLERCMAGVGAYISLWESYSELWAKDKDEVMDRFEALNPSAMATFDPDTGEYTQIQIHENIFQLIFNLSQVIHSS